MNSLFRPNQPRIRDVLVAPAGLEAYKRRTFNKELP